MESANLIRFEKSRAGKKNQNKWIDGFDLFTRRRGQLKSMSSHFQNEHQMFLVPKLKDFINVISLVWCLKIYLISITDRYHCYEILDFGKIVFGIALFGFGSVNFV